MPPRLAAAGSPRPDRILILGEAHRARRIRTSLERRTPLERGAERGALDGGVVTAVSVAEAARWLAQGGFRVAIVVAPLRGAMVERAVSRLQGAAPEREPVTFVSLVAPTFSEARVKGLYERGVRGVFTWPDDLPILRGLLERALSRDDPEPDAALEASVRERLRLRLRWLLDAVAIETTGGVARVSGRVASLWAKLALRRQAVRSPGIDAVEDEGLAVERTERSDAAIGREIRALLHGTTSIEASTVGVSVHDGRVVLLGTLLADEHDRVIELLSMVPGVRSVEDLAVESADDKQHAAELARRLEREVRRGDAGRGLRIAVVGATAVLRGVGSPHEARRALRRLRRWIRRDDSLQRVVAHVSPCG